MAIVTKVMVVRHCEAEGNINRVFQGHTNAAVSTNGRKQLDLLQIRCRNLPIDIIYTSPLQRAYATAEAINEFHQVPIRVCDDLIEINGGVWEGKKWADLPGLYPEDARKWNMEPEFCACTGGAHASGVRPDEQGFAGHCAGEPWEIHLHYQPWVRDP